MKISLLLPLFFIFSSLAICQSHEEEATSSWLTQIETAKAKATETDRPILMVFSGSDWCKPCILLKREFFNSKEFSTYSDENLILLELDFPARSKNKLTKEQVKHNEALADKFNPEGVFPLALIVKPDDTILGTFGYDKNRTPEDYIQQLNGFLNAN